MILQKSEDGSHSNKEGNYRTAGGRLPSLSRQGLTKASNTRLSGATTEHKAFLASLDYGRIMMSIN